jgi:hypothetical protein
MRILARLKQQLIDKGTPINRAEQKAINFLRKAGIIHKEKLELTEYGRVRDNMTEAERAISRKTKETGKPVGRYYYDPFTNKAKLRKYK